MNLAEQMDHSSWNSCLLLQIFCYFDLNEMFHSKIYLLVQ